MLKQVWLDVSARSIARRHGIESVVVAARNGGLPKRYTNGGIANSNFRNSN